jgi:hypothetical protein
MREGEQFDLHAIRQAQVQLVGSARFPVRLRHDRELEHFGIEPP